MLNFKSISLVILSVVFLSGRSFAQNTVTNSRTIAFIYEGESKRNNSKVFPNGKTDYVWGRAESHEDHFHRIRRSVYQAQPDSKNFAVRLVEDVDVDGGRLQIQLRTEIEVERPIDSVAAARQLANDALNDTKPQYFFYQSNDAVAQWRKRMSDFFFLGETSKVNLLDVDTNPNNRGTVEIDGKKHQFAIDPETNFVVELVVNRPPDPLSKGSSSASENPFGPPVRSLGGTSEYKFDLTDANCAVWTFESNTRMADNGDVRFSEEYRITDLSNDVHWPFKIENHPKNGDKITLMEQQQIAAAWQDGKIVRVYDQGIAEELASAQFLQPKNNNVFRVVLIASVATALFIVYRSYRFRRRRSND